MVANFRTKTRVGGLLLLFGAVLLAPLLLSTEPRIQRLAGASFLLALESTLICVPIGVFLAWLLTRTNTPGRRLMLTAMAWLLFVPLYLQAAAWEAGFGQLGWYTLMTGSVSEPLLDGWRAAVWVQAMTSVPWVVLIVGIGLRFVEAELEEHAMLDGGVGQVLLLVTVPRAWLAVGVAALWVFVTACSEMTIADLFLVSTYARELYAGYALGDGFQEAWKATIPSLATLVWLISAMVFCLSLIAPPVSRESFKQPALVDLRNGKWVAFLLSGAVVCVVAVLPLANLLVKAGLTAEQVAGERIRYWSATKFLETIGPIPWSHREDFGWTLLIGAGASTAAVLLAAPCAWLARRRSGAALAALVAAAVCLATPGPLLGLCIIKLLNHDVAFLIWLYDDTLFAPILALTVRAFPFALGISWYGLRSVTEDVLESGELEGAGLWRQFVQLAAPQRRQAWAGAWLAALAITTGDLSASILVTPPGVTTVAIRVFGLIHSGVRYQAAGVSLASAVMFGLLAAIGWKLIVGRK